MSVLDVLEASRDILLAIDPSPLPALQAVHVNPKSDEELNTPHEDDFPFGVVLEALFLQPVEVKRFTVADYERHWLMEWLIFLGPAGTRDAALEEMGRTWYPLLEDALLSNPTINGTVDRFGSDSRDGANSAFTMRMGHLHYFFSDQNAALMGGIEVTIPVVTMHEYEENYEL